MSRQEVVMIKCDRCKREELRPANTSAKNGTDFDCTFMGKKLHYEDLCVRCKKTVEYMFNLVSEWERDLKSILTIAANGHDPQQAPPVTPAPDYIPPRPHSDASPKR